MTDTKTMVTALNVIADELQAMNGTVQAQCIRDAAEQLADRQKTIDQLEMKNTDVVLMKFVTDTCETGQLSFPDAEWLKDYINEWLAEHGKDGE